MKTFSQLKPGDIFRSNSGTWRKIFPRPNTERRMAAPWNAVKLDPPDIHPNLWRHAERLRQSGDEKEADALATELNELAISPVYGTFPAGFLVSEVADEVSA